MRFERLSDFQSVCANTDPIIQYSYTFTTNRPDNYRGWLSNQSDHLSNWSAYTQCTCLKRHLTQRFSTLSIKLLPSVCQLFVPWALERTCHDVPPHKATIYNVKVILHLLEKVTCSSSKSNWLKILITDKAVEA